MAKGKKYTRYTDTHIGILLNFQSTRRYVHNGAKRYIAIYWPFSSAGFLWYCTCCTLKSLEGTVIIQLESIILGI